MEAWIGPAIVAAIISGLKMWETWRDFAAQAEAALNEGGASVAGTGAGLPRDRLGSG